MAISKDFKEQISHLPKETLEKLVIKIASKDKSFSDFLELNYFANGINENDIFEDYKQKLNKLVFKRYKGYAEEEKAAHFITACNKELANFEKLCKNKELFVQLILVVLDSAYNDFGARFGTCFTVYEYKFSLLLKKAIKTITTKLHEDLLIEYKHQINRYLNNIKTANYLDYIYLLPNEI